MERVAFLLEDTGVRLDCLLNPESLEVSRLAGVRQRGVGTGRLTGLGLADDPLHLTGGGRTELSLDLLFDVDLAPTPGGPTDVRALTRPLWQLAENSASEHGAVRPPLVRFVWGKSWNLPGIVTAVAERFDRFDVIGVPQRSWFRMRLLRAADSAAEAQAEYDALVSAAEASAQLAAEPTPPAAESTRSVVAVGEGDRPDGPSTMRFDLLATDGLGNPFLWRLLAAHNGIDDPLRVPPGTVLAVPPAVAPPPPAVAPAPITGSAP